MIGAIGDTLLLGLGIALNPIAIVISILIANRADPRRNGIALVLGWILGLLVLVALPALLIQDRLPLPNGERETPEEPFALFRAALGVILLIAAAASIAKGPLPGDRAADPRWARLLDSGGVGRIFGLGAFLSIVNIRNLILLAAVASIIGQARLGLYAWLLVVAVFVAIATLGILLPFLVHLFGGEASEARLGAWADWLSRNMGAITGAIMALFGAILLTNGVQGVL